MIVPLVEVGRIELDPTNSLSATVEYVWKWDPSSEQELASLMNGFFTGFMVRLGIKFHILVNLYFLGIVLYCVD